MKFLFLFCFVCSWALQSKSPFYSYLAKSEKQHYAWMLNNGDNALWSRVQLIRDAQVSVEMQTFIFINDEVGRLLGWELLQAAKRGVQVKIIADQMFSESNHGLIAYLATAHPNLKLKHYNPPQKHLTPGNWNMLKKSLQNFKKINQRMHNKTFIVDGQVAIAGGRNYENTYFNRGKDYNYKDRDVLFIGEQVSILQNSFSLYWQSPLSVSSFDLKDIAPLIPEGKHPEYPTQASYYLGESFHHFQDTLTFTKKVRTFLRPVKHLQVYADKPGKNTSNDLQGSGAITDTLVNTLYSARKSITIQSPYLVLSDRATRVFEAIHTHRPEVKIKVSTNSLASTDATYAYAFSYKQKKKNIQDLGFHIYEMKPYPNNVQQFYHAELGHALNTPSYSFGSVSHKTPPNGLDKNKGPLTCLHAKSAVLDSKVAIIGSYNFDPRSANLNTEVLVIIHDKVFAQALEKNILRDTQSDNSWVVGVRKKIPILGTLSGWMENLSSKIPIFDIWPFRYAALFEKKKDGLSLHHTDPDFHKHYKDVGSFPEVGLNGKQIETRLIKAFAGFTRPIM